MRTKISQLNTGYIIEFTSEYQRTMELFETLSLDEIRAF